MSVCRFHVAGICKFGTYCRNKHEVGGCPPEAYHLNAHKTRPQLSLPSDHFKDNLSRDYRFIVPSPTVESDKIFYSSDSDWDERGIDDLLGEISSLAIVSCSSCGFQELKQQPCAVDTNLCLKCQEDRNGNVVKGEFKDLESKKKRKKRKKKPVATVSNLTDLYEGTPEGVKVYKMKEESKEDFEEQQPFENVLKEKKGVKAKKLNKECSKTKLLSQNSSPKKENTYELPIAKAETFSVQQPSLYKFWLTSIGLYLAIFCQVFNNLTLMLVNLPHTIKVLIYDYYQDSAVEEMWDRAYRYMSGNKGTKYSRRRKIIK